MSRTLSYTYQLCVFAVLALFSSAAHAQSPGRAKVGGSPARPAANAQGLPEQKITPLLTQVLKEWYEGTRKIKKLEGRHYKFDYELTFGVETRGTGRFYYETPDRGRIDIEPTKIKAGEKSARVGRRTKKPFALKTAKAVKWLSTGKSIYQVQPDKKKATVYPIPAANRGVNIMDGPLPFLLGMPPAKALQRYVLRIDSNSEKDVRLTVWPRWRSDRSTFAVAKIILMKKNHYLPYAVQMVDQIKNPTKETVYTFFELEVNKTTPGWKIWVKDPFRLDLRDYKIESGIPKAVATRTTKPGGTNRTTKPASVKKVAMPEILRIPYKDAIKKLQALGLKYSIRKGSVIKNEKYAYYVENQSPAAKTMVPVGEKVVLVLYIKAADAKPKGRTAARPPQ